MSPFMLNIHILSQKIKFICSRFRNNNKKCDFYIDDKTLNRTLTSRVALLSKCPKIFLWRHNIQPVSKKDKENAITTQYIIKIKT